MRRHRTCYPFSLFIFFFRGSVFWMHAKHFSFDIAQMCAQPDALNTSNFYAKIVFYAWHGRRATWRDVFWFFFLFAEKTWAKFIWRAKHDTFIFNIIIRWRIRYKRATHASPMHDKSCHEWCFEWKCHSDPKSANQTDPSWNIRKTRIICLHMTVRTIESSSAEFGSRGFDPSHFNVVPSSSGIGRNVNVETTTLPFMWCVTYSRIEKKKKRDSSKFIIISCSVKRKTRSARGALVNVRVQK